jgi:hypothetical protein
MFKFLRPNTKTTKHTKRKSFNALKYVTKQKNNTYGAILNHNNKWAELKLINNNNSPPFDEVWDLTKKYLVKRDTHKKLHDKINKKWYNKAVELYNKELGQKSRSSRSSHSHSQSQSVKRSAPQITKHIKQHNRTFAAMGNSFRPKNFAKQLTPIASGKGDDKKHSFFRETMV